MQIISDIVFLTKSAEKLQEVSEFGETGHPRKMSRSICPPLNSVTWKTPWNSFSKAGSFMKLNSYIRWILLWTSGQQLRLAASHFCSSQPSSIHRLRSPIFPWSFGHFFVQWSHFLSYTTFFSSSFSSCHPHKPAPTPLFH